MCDESNDMGDRCKLLTVLVTFFDPKTETPSNILY